MPSRRPDTIRIESPAGSFDKFNSLTITNDITQGAEMTFDVGEDGSFPELGRLLGFGSEFKVYLNDRLRMTGRVYLNDSPNDASNGSTVTVTLRSKMADARYASADPKTRVQGTSLRDFLLAIYAPVGFSEADFVFNASVERDLITGKTARGALPPVPLEPIKIQDAKVNPPETIFDAAARHLKRHRLMHWETPEGKIYVGKPDDQQSPIYKFRLKRGPASAGNNLLSARRVKDYSEVPSIVRVYGTSGGKQIARASVQGVSADLDLLGVHRPVIILSEGAKTRAQAEAQARRERAQRSRRKDTFELLIDGWSYWTGSGAIPFSPNTTCDVDVDTVGGPQGRYFVERVQCSLSPGQGQMTSLSIVAPGVWEL
ncbi:MULTISPECIES: hypothetical protein [Sorangium]|uniref:Phage tail protein n=1 Tax=Sorangium cellulosum TaxID=56 RepID=A0A4P2QPZ6_SORCE|nr:MULTISPECIES: hypothetical protein [Sorangium]AUX31921.1 uncharacterized protein SOCE836_040560 [Sorangium cellulosum]WCQ91295.1 tail protein [Sorangium sp. Soce836]